MQTEVPPFEAGKQGCTHVTCGSRSKSTVVAEEDCDKQVGGLAQVPLNTDTPIAKVELTAVSILIDWKLKEQLKGPRIS